MVDGQLFDTLAKLAVQLRKKTDKPFGGIQVLAHVSLVCTVAHYAIHR